MGHPAISGDICKAWLLVIARDYTKPCGICAHLGVNSHMRITRAIFGQFCTEKCYNAETNAPTRTATRDPVTSWFSQPKNNQGLQNNSQNYKTFSHIFLVFLPQNRMENINTSVTVIPENY